MGFLIFYVLPFIWCLLISPKFFAVVSKTNVYRPEDMRNPVRTRDLTVGLLLSLVPFLNIISCFVITFLFAGSYEDIMKDNKFWDFQIFGKKERKAN